MYESKGYFVQDALICCMGTHPSLRYVFGL